MRDFEDLMMMRMLGLDFGSTVDWVAVFSFFVVALIYFLAPVVGYGPGGRGTLVASLYLLLAYAGATALQYSVFYLQMLDRNGPGRPDELMMLTLFGFSVVKLLLFVVALLLFVIGLQSMRL